MVDMELDEIFGTEIWNEHDEFLYTAITARCGSVVQYGEIKDRGCAEDLVPRVQLSPVPSDEIYPLLLKHLKVWASKVNEEWMYIKRPNCRAYGQVRGSQTLAQEFLHEIQVYEQINTKQHRNLPQYHGCVVERGRVVGIVLDRYVCTLAIRRGSMDHASCLECFSGASAGVKHLHDIGLAHNDLNPTNVMFDGDGNTIITDFDSCAPEHVHLVKTGTPGWSDGFAECSSFTNDELALKMLRKYLEL